MAEHTLPGATDRRSSTTERHQRGTNHPHVVTSSAFEVIKSAEEVTREVVNLSVSRFIPPGCTKSKHGLGSFVWDVLGLGVAVRDDAL